MEYRISWKNNIITEISKLSAFYRAEDYHQDYYSKNSNQGYCQMVIAPKIVKFRLKYGDTAP